MLQEAFQLGLYGLLNVEIATVEKLHCALILRSWGAVDSNFATTVQPQYESFRD